MGEIFHFFTAPFTAAFMQQAFIVTALTGSVCAVFSCFLVLKGWSLMGDAISHAVLPGLGLAYLLGLPLSLGAFGAGLLCAYLIETVKSHSRIKEDAVMAIIFSGLFAAGLLILTTIQTDIHLMHILFGNVLGILPADFIQICVMGTASLLALLIKRKDFMLHCFDPVQTRIMGLPNKTLHLSLLVLLACTIIAALKASGIILVIAMLIAPGATAYLLSPSFDRMLALAVASAVSASLIGTFTSYHWDVATAPLIVCIQAGFFILALFAYKMKHKRRGARA